MERSRRINATRNSRGSAGGTSLSSFASALEDSIDKNRNLQQQILSSLQELGSKMGNNRHRASQLTLHLHMASEQESETSAESREQTNDSSATIPQSPNNHTTLNKENADPYRSWKRQFFIDRSGNVPEPNEDTLKRRRLEKEAKHFFYHLSPPWSSNEIETFKSLVEDGNAISSKHNFDQVARELQNRRKKNADLPLQKPRTAEECKVQFERLLSECQVPFTKAETAQVLDLVKQRKRSNEKKAIDWNEIAKAVGTNRTTWQSFVAYQKSQNYGSLWTTYHDEVLLKYLSALGPQFILSNKATVSDISRQLFPDKADRSIAERANISLVNPKLHRAIWTDMEERKLALAQKVYQESPAHVASHFPHRGSKSVYDKWKRTLDPAYTKSRPFTKKEDELLFELVGKALQKSRGTPDSNDSSPRQSNEVSNIAWTRLQRQHFPDRRPEQLIDRWTRTLASDKDILLAVKSRLARTKRGRTTAASADVASLDDFAVQVIPQSNVKKKRKC